ncbi:DegQ family serine endoprotease [Magnetovibrio sp.]|uniref:DegQ family serine endoprotease n=1 Tax=Magnetovibrio sp. TaxID=2024836 RepID=UPI002F9550A8
MMKSHMMKHRSHALAPAGVNRSLTLMLAVLATAMLLLQPLAANAKGAPESFADLADKLLPAVVNVSTTQVIEGKSSMPDMPQFPPGSPFEDFFKDFFDKNGGGGQHPQKRKATSLGSGFIIDYRKNGDAYVVTNNHVVEGADEVSVILQDDTRLKAEIVGRDAKSDLAVLKVHTDRKLPSVGFGDSTASRVGDWVVAIGNPFGLGGTVTAGIISARGRDINAGPYDDFIQTDASINRGNSGGPMFNMQGEVIGINTAIFSPSGGSVGIGFAIPSNAAQVVIEQLIQYGQVSRGWLGVHIQVVTDSIAETLGLKKAEGALVASVIEDGPAAKAGIKARDVILEFDGKHVNEMRKLPRIVASTPVEKAVSVKVWRDGKIKTLSVMIGRLDDDKEVVASADEQPKGKTAEHALNELGLTVSLPTAEVLQRFDLADGVDSLVITDVDADSQAYEEGIRAGDLLTEVNQEKVKTPADAERVVKAAKKDGKRSVLLLIEGQAGFRFVAVKLQ